MTRPIIVMGLFMTRITLQYRWCAGLTYLPRCQVIVTFPVAL